MGRGTKTHGRSWQFQVTLRWPEAILLPDTANQEALGAGVLHSPSFSSFLGSSHSPALFYRCPLTPPFPGYSSLPLQFSFPRPSQFSSPPIPSFPNSPQIRGSPACLSDRSSRWPWISQPLPCPNPQAFLRPPPLRLQCVCLPEPRLPPEPALTRFGRAAACCAP